MGVGIRIMIYIVGTHIPNSKNDQLNRESFVVKNDVKDVIQFT